LSKIVKYAVIAVVAPIMLIIFLIVAAFVFGTVSSYWTYNCAGQRAKEILKHQFPGIQTVDEKGIGSSDWMVLAVEDWYCIAFTVKDPAQTAKGLQIMENSVTPADNYWTKKLISQWPEEKDNINACKMEYLSHYCDMHGHGTDKMLLHSAGSKRYYYIYRDWTQASP